MKLTITNGDIETVIEGKLRLDPAPQKGEDVTARIISTLESSRFSSLIAGRKVHVISTSTNGRTGKVKFTHAYCDPGADCPRCVEAAARVERLRAIVADKKRRVDAIETEAAELEGKRRDKLLIQAALLNTEIKAATLELEGVE